MAPAVRKTATAEERAARAEEKADDIAQTQLGNQSRLSYRVREKNRRSR